MEKEEKIRLLRLFLEDEIYVKAILETLSERELDRWLNANLEVLLKKDKKDIY